MNFFCTFAVQKITNHLNNYYNEEKHFCSFDGSCFVGN